MVEISVRKGKGYRGKMGRPSYVARICGTHPQYGLDREFRDADDVDWEEYDPRKRKGVITEIHHLHDGLYEVQEWGERDYLIVEDDELRHVDEDEIRSKLEE